MSSTKKTQSKIFTFIFLCLLIKSACWNYDSNGSDWPDSCKAGEQAPIDISPPFTYQPNPLKFSYAEMNTEYLLYHDGNNLILEGDFGFIEFDNKIYSSSHVLFFSPSHHSFKSRKFPLEMQIVHQDEEGNKITICVLFKESENDYSLILGKLGFDEEEMITLEPLMKKTIKDRINLGKYVGNDKDFFIYNSFEPVPPCNKKDVFFILSDILNVNKDQLAHFPIMIQNQFRSPQQRLGRNIFITIPLNQFEEKIQENRKILQENEERIKTNDALEKVEEKHSEENVQDPRSQNKDEDELGVIIPFEKVKQKIIAKEKLNKKTEVKLLTSKSSTLTDNQSMIIDKEIPKSEGEIKRGILKEKYFLWKDLYKLLTQGEKIEDEQTKQILLFQMKKLERELRENNYLPYLNFIYRENNYYSEYHSSFLELESPHKKKLKPKQKSMKIISNEITDLILTAQKEKYNLNTPYSVPPISIDNETLVAKGRIPYSEMDNDTATIFDITSWPVDCKRASYLSPINIDLTNQLPFESKSLQFFLTGPQGKVFVNNDDYKIIVFSEGSFGYIQYFDHIYNAKRIVFHLPSEHTFSRDEVRSAFEMQIICFDNFENIAAVSVLFDVGATSFEFLNIIGFGNDNNYIFSKKIRNNEKIEIENTDYVKKGMDLSYLFNNNPNNKFVSYIGTTTTPPCKTNVKWFVSLNKLSLTQSQLDMFPIIYGRFRNVRGIQQLNGREIKIIG